MKHPASSPAAKRQARKAKQLQTQSRKSSAASCQTSAGLAQMPVVHRRACGIDVGSAENYAAIPAEGLPPGESAVRVFGVFSDEQDALVEWLRQHQVTTVAMETTGVYWLSLYDKLEAAGLDVFLVDAHSVKAVPGRKSDRLDCQWLQKLHTYGLLAKAFRPDEAIRGLRKLTRQRAELVMCAGVHQQHMGKAMISMNLHLDLAVSDLAGETGMRIIRAILAGVRDPKELVKLRDPRCRKSTVAEMEQALTGSYEEEELFVLEQSVEAWDFYQKQIEACDQKLAKVLESIPTSKAAPPPVPPKPAAVATGTEARIKKKQPHHGNAPTIDFTQTLIRICGVDLTRVCGLNVLTVLMLIGEIGVDMSRWRSERAFCSWLGLCPGAKISGGKVLSRRTRKVVNRASAVLRLAAWAAGKSDTWLGLFYRRIKSRRGAPKAVTATARKLACIIYHMLKYKEEFVLLDRSKWEAQAQAHRLRRLQKEAKSMGYEIIESKQLA